jgi:hypothetical protein
MDVSINRAAVFQAPQFGNLNHRLAASHYPLPLLGGTMDMKMAAVGHQLLGRDPLRPGARKLRCDAQCAIPLNSADSDFGSGPMSASTAAIAQAEMASNGREGRFVT